MATTKTRSLVVSVTTEATASEPAFTYYADGTDVMVVWDEGRKSRRGTTAGMTTNTRPYPFQLVRWSDGTTDTVAPHVIHLA